MKKIAIFLAVSVALVVSLFILIDLTYYPMDYAGLEGQPEFSECVKEMERQASDYFEGQIVISFESGVSEAEINDLLEDYSEDYGFEENITIFNDNPEHISWGVVNVPKGKEVELICKFRQESIVRNANLVFITSTAEAVATDE